MLNGFRIVRLGRHGAYSGEEAEANQKSQLHSPQIVLFTDLSKSQCLLSNFISTYLPSLSNTGALGLLTLLKNKSN